LAEVSAEVLEASTLISFRQALGSALCGGDTPLLLSASIYHRTRRRHSLQFCPVCFSGQSLWFRRIWRLGFVLLCPEHGVPLLDSCPVCDSPVIPHRALGLNLGHCHECGSRLYPATASKICTERVLQMQTLLLGNLLTPSGTWAFGTFHGLELFTLVRSLLSVLTVRSNYLIIRDVFRLPSISQLPSDRLQFEHARWVDRVLLMEVLAACMSDWPASFHLGAKAAGLTQKTFQRLRQSEALRLEVQCLPPGYSRDRKYEPKIFDGKLLRLKRIDLKAYRALRAKRLLHLAGLT